MPLVVRVDNLETGESQQFAFIKSPVRVGRSEINDLHLDLPYVSTWHGLVQFEGEKVTFVDLGSTNGTTLDGARLEKNAPVEIGPGADLRIGALQLHLQRREAGHIAAAPRRATAFAIRAAGSQPAMPAEGAPPEGVRHVRPVPGAGPVGRLSGTFAPPPGATLAPVAPPPAAPAEEPVAAPPLTVPPAAPAIPPPSTPGRDLAKEALDDASWQLQVLHDGLAEARHAFDEAAEMAASRLPEADRARFRGLVGEKFGAEAALQAAAPVPLGVLGAAPAVAPGGGDLGQDALGLLRAFAESYLPAGTTLDGPEHVKALLESVADVLETSARSYVELRRGYEEFGKEMGLRVAQGEGPVARARDARQLLAWLLARSGGDPRAPELASAFADLMIHQVALLNGVTEGAKALLQRLSPEAIGEALEKGGGFSLGVKALREGAQWRAYVERYRELADEDAALTEVLFGKDFARAYSAVAGRRVGTQEAPDRDATPRPGDDRDATPRPGPAPGHAGPGSKDRRGR